MKAKVLGIETTSNGFTTSSYVGLVLRASYDEIRKMLDKHKFVLIRKLREKNYASDSECDMCGSHGHNDCHM